MPPAVDTAGESERRHSRDSGNEEEFEILEREEVKIEEHRRSEDSGNCSEAEEGQDTNRVLEFQLTQSLLSQVKAGENNRDANSGRQAQLDLKRMSFVINGKEISKEYVGKLYIKCNHLIPSENEDYRPFAKKVFIEMFKYAKAEIPNYNVLEELITNCNQAGYEFAVYGHIHPILDQYGLIPTIPKKTVSLCCNSAGCIDVEYSDVIVVKNPDQLRQYEAFSKLEFTLKSQDDRAEYENGKVTLTIPKELENYKADGKSLLDNINRHFVDVDNTIIESLVENIGEGPKSFVVNLPAEVNSDSFDIIPENAVFDLGHIPELIKKAVDDKDVNDLANHIGSFQDHVTHVSPKEGLPVVEKILEIVSGFIEEQGKAWNCHPTVPIASHIYSAKQQYKEILCKIKSNLIKRSSNDHNAGPSVTNAQDTSAILNETPTSSQAVSREQLNTKESKNQQLQRNVVDKIENIMNNEEASIEEAISNNYRRGKVSKNKKSSFSSKYTNKKKVQKNSQSEKVVQNAEEKVLSADSGNIELLDSRLGSVGSSNNFSVGNVVRSDVSKKEDTMEFLDNSSYIEGGCDQQNSPSLSSEDDDSSKNLYMISRKE
ncbi:hypothetical protein [Wolbachia endosymbiont (group B) of Gerris lacustris]|uniref:hypothetical protein n=1 Tax=Wolbachia endosymbiont (group B) of Gerris lacustris TaxID=3066159 RepID=UPI0033403278